MIIEKESEIKVLRNFYDRPFYYFSIAKISERTKISRTWIYRVLKKFENFGILIESGKKYKLDFSNIFCKRLKLFFDSDYLNSLSKDVKRDVFNIANKIVFEMNPESIVLVGSAALQKMRRDSDIDFLVIGKNGREKIPQFENINVILLSEREFEVQYMKGDDFVVSALAFGKIIHDNGAFIKFFENPLPIFSQELIQEKIKYCEKVEERIYALLRLDATGARNELLYLALQVARIILLKNRIIPETKYDIASQVRVFDRDIAKIIKDLLEMKKTKIKTEEMLDYTKKCMSVIK